MTHRTMSVPILLLAMVLTANAQFPWQKPTPRSRESIEKILGPITKQELSRDVNIVWVWGIDKLHAKETHEYAWVMDRYVNQLLPKVPRVTVTHAMWFPSKEQWEKADLVVFYFTFNDPYFRIILLRAMAWAMNESFEPFKPLVMQHLER